MADKSYIELKLDPDKMKEELRKIIPGYRALEYFHNNPDSSFTNTLDLLAEDVVPFYAAYKYGAEPEDYIKEAILMNLPMRGGARFSVDASSLREAVNAHPRRKYYNLGNSDLVYKSGKKYIDAADDKPLEYIPNNEPKPYNNLNEVLKDINESEYLTNKYAPIDESYYDIKDKQEGLNSYNEFIRTNKVKPNEEVFYSDISSSNRGFKEINVVDKNTGEVKSYWYDINKKKYEPYHYVYDVNDLVPGAKMKPVQQSDIDLMSKKLQEDIGLFNIELDDYPDYSPIRRDAIYDWKYQQEEGR